MVDKQKILSLTPEDMEKHGFLTRSADGKFVCPNCGNGSGEDGTGIDFVFQDGIWKANCFKCEPLDNIKVIAAHYHLDYKTDFVEILRRAETEFFGDASRSETKSKMKEDVKMNAELHDYSVWYQMAMKDLPGFLSKNGGSYRAITEETWRKNKVGYLPAHGEFKLPYLLIPFTKHYWQMRLAMDDADALKICGDLKTVKKIKKLFPSRDKAGAKPVQNFDRLISAAKDDIFFAPEGPLDALSIQQCGFKAISFLGSSISQSQAQDLSQLNVKPSIIVLFDNDETGEVKASKAVATLINLGFQAAKMFLPTKFQKPDGELCHIKDANDFLQVSAQGLTDCLKQMLTDAPAEFIKASRMNNNSENNNEAENVQSGKKQRKTSRSFYPDCPVDVVIPWDFALGKTGLYKRFKTQDSELMTRYPIFIEAIRHSALDDEIKKCKYDLCWKKPTENFWRHILDVPAHQIADCRALQKVFADNQILVDSKTASRLSTYFARMLEDPDNLDRIPSKIIFSETGWTNDDFNQFVYPTNKKGDCYVENNFNFEKMFTKKGKRDKVRDLLMDIILSSPEARLALGCVTAAPLLKPLHLRNTILHLWGTSEIGKTGFVKALMSIFGNPELMQGSWGDTPNFILQRANKFQDLPVYIDDTQKMQKKTRDNIDTIIYKLEDGATKGRLNKNAEGMEVTHAHYSVISTGEQPLSTYTTQQGVLTRTLQIKCDGFISPTLAKQCHIVSADNFGHYGRDFVNWLAASDRLEQLRKYWLKLYDTIRYRAARANGWQGSLSDIDQLTKNDVGLIDTHIQNVATCLTALHAFTQFAFADHKDMNKAVEDLINFDIDDFIKNQTLQKLSTNAKRLLPAIIESTDTQSKRFMFERQPNQEVYKPETNLPILGIKLADGRIGFYRQEFKKFLRDLGAQSAEEIISGLHDLGVLDESDSKTAEETFKFAKSVSWKDGQSGERIKRWMYVFKPEVLQQV